jgi:deazaflavin-dependent oxidoreductase (nitroreductase family)
MRKSIVLGNHSVVLDERHESQQKGTTVSPVPSDFALKTMNFVHKTILTVSGGKKGWNAGNMPVLKLTTTGRTSGLPREVMLTSPVQQGDAFVVVASRGGDDHHPAWFVNLRDNATVWIATQDQPKHERRARIATQAERDTLWPTIVAKYANYGGYQSKTDREIPLVFLDKI